MEEEPVYWSVNLFAIGNISQCLLSWFCNPCAVAMSRYHLDGSNFCFNLCCVSRPAARWLTRTAYGIEGDAWEDCFLSLFCPCCVTNQLLQTAIAKGRPIPNSGVEFNVRSFEGDISGKSFCDFCLKCCYGCCCMQCAAATIMSKGVGMPCLYSCCFVNIFAARNFVRYQNRVKGNDCIDECCVPWSTYCCGGLLSAIIPCFWCIVCPAFVLFIVQLLNEVEKRPAAQPRYLVGAADNVIAAAITLAPPEVYGKVIAMNPIRESNEIPNETIPETNPNYQTADDTKAEIPIVHGVPIREDQSSTVSPKAEN